MNICTNLHNRACSHSLDVEETFTGSPSFAEGSDSQAGLLLDLSYAGATSKDWRVAGGVRFYPIELETHVFADDQVTIENIFVMYGRIGYVFDSINMLYGVLEIGNADITIRQEGYNTITDDVSTSALGVGYARSINESTEFFVEILGRGYDEYRVSYIGGHLDGESAEYEITGGNLNFGLAIRF